MPLTNVTFDMVRKIGLVLPDVQEGTMYGSRNDSFSDVQRRCNDYNAEGVTEVWLLEPDLKRAYTVTKSEGLREFKGDVLRIANPPLEMDLRAIFD